MTRRLPDDPNDARDGFWRLMVLLALIAVAPACTDGARAPDRRDAPQVQRHFTCSLDPAIASSDVARERYGEVLQRVLAIPGVGSAALASQVTLDNFVGPAERQSQDISVAVTVVVADYFQTLGVP